MCEHTCLICEQCDDFRNGCLGQTGTFDNVFCPSYMFAEEKNPVHQF